MATATKVPQTRTMTGEELSADDAWRTLRAAGIGRQLKDAFVRLRYADGFSHARALAFQMCLATFPGLIALVGLAQSAHQARWGEALQNAIERIAPASSRPRSCTPRSATRATASRSRCGSVWPPGCCP